ncbi:MAG: MBL fold metallo-hydrolase [Baekduia sp.]
MSAPVIHSLNCSTMCPNGAVRLGIIEADPGHLVAQCLLIEGSSGLILVDTGFGTDDVRDRGRLGPARLLTGPILDEKETAIRQIEGLGLDPADVRHIVVTHLDLDHAGGIGDFPNAEVHVHRTELDAALHPTRRTATRYRSAQWAHGPKWAAHETQDGDAWNGFARARLLEDAGAEVALIALHGHTSGHSGVAIDTGSGWLLHAGDAYLHHGEIETPVRTTRGRVVYHRFNSVDETLRRENAARLAELAREHAGDVTVFCSHDPADLVRVRAKLAGV